LKREACGLPFFIGGTRHATNFVAAWTETARDMTKIAQNKVLVTDFVAFIAEKYTISGGKGLARRLQ